MCWAHDRPPLGSIQLSPEDISVTSILHVVICSVVYFNEFQESIVLKMLCNHLRCAI
jgi:hypothetical protein